MSTAQKIIDFSKGHLSGDWAVALEEADANVDGMVEWLLDSILDMLEEDPRGLRDVEYEITSELQAEIETMLWNEFYPGDDFDINDEYELEIKPTVNIQQKNSTKQLHDWQKPEEYDF